MPEFEKKKSFSLHNHHHIVNSQLCKIIMALAIEQKKRENTVKVAGYGPFHPFKYGPWSYLRGF